MTEVLTATWQLLGVFVAIAAAAVWLRSTLAKQRTTELEHLVETRGLKIDDLQEEIDVLRQEMAEMRGEMSALHQLKTDEIARRTAEAVVGELLPFLKGA